MMKLLRLAVLLSLVLVTPACADNVRISDLPSVPSIASGDVFPVVHSGVTYKGSMTSLNTFLNGNYTGGTAQTTLGTITTGVWNGSPVPVLYGGTGATTAAGARSNLGISGGSGFDSLFGLSGATPTGTQFPTRTANAAYTTQHMPELLGATSILDYAPDFYSTVSGQPSITVPNAVMTPGSAGSTIYTGDNARHIILQDFYLYAQRKSIDNGAQHFASLHIPSCIDAITTGGPFAYKTNTPVFFPRYVCPNDKMSWERDGTGTAVAARSNWNGDPTTNQLNNPGEYMLVMAMGGTMAAGSKLIGNLNSTGSDGGNGFMYGRMYEASTVALQATGTGGPSSGTSVCTVLNGDTVTPSTGAVFTVSTTAGGVASAITSPAAGAYTRYGSNAGLYELPPWLQRRQWTVGNGWDGSDSRHPQVFADETNYYYKTTCTNGLTGVTVSLKWQPDYCLTGITADVDSAACNTRTDGPSGTNSYYGIFAIGSANTGYLDHVYMIQGRQTYTANYGYTNSFLKAGYEITTNYVQTEGSYFGTLDYGTDSVIIDLNSVNEAIMYKQRGGGGLHLLHGRFDTPIDIINGDAHAWEIDHCTTCSIKSWDYIATGSSNSAAGAQGRLGSDTAISNASNENTNVYVGVGNISSDKSGTQANLTALSCAYTNSSTFGANVSNTGFGNAARNQQFTVHTAFGSNCEKSNVDLGSINNLAAGSIFSGTVPNIGIQVWNATSNSFIGALGAWPVGRLSGQYSAAGVGNAADTTDDVLFTYSLPASTLNTTGQTIEVSCNGGTAANGNNKVVKLWFGSELITSGVVTPSAKNWTASLLIGRTGASTQRVSGTMLVDTTQITPYAATGAETETNAIVIKCTGSSSTTGAASDVLGYGMTVKFLN